MLVHEAGTSSKPWVVLKQQRTQLCHSICGRIDSQQNKEQTNQLYKGVRASTIFLYENQKSLFHKKFTQYWFKYIKKTLHLTGYFLRCHSFTKCQTKKSVIEHYLERILLLSGYTMSPYCARDVSITEGESVVNLLKRSSIEGSL